MKEREIKIYGQHACQAVFKQRPDDILRVLLEENCKSNFLQLLRHCAQEHKPYRIITSQELEKVAGARHHEGICLVSIPKWSRPLQEILSDAGNGLILALDGVGNPHNIGTLLRTSVHFGVKAVLLGGPMKRLSSAAYRTAEGAAEFVDLVFEEDLNTALKQCKDAGYQVCATSSHKGDSLYGTNLPARTLMLLGAERDGLSNEAMKTADHLLSIPGSEQVESLNVAASTAVLLAEYWRQQNTSQ